MNPRKRKSLTIPQAIAIAVRRERLGREWRQEDLAEKMSDLGFAWSRMTVTEIERGDPENASKRQQARQVSVEELLGLTYAFGMGLDAFLWDGRPLELALPERRARGGLPLVLNNQWELWITLLSYSSVEQITGSQAAALMKVERRRVEAAMADRIKYIAEDLHSVANHYETTAMDMINPKEDK
jgi:transcriptional regulator with XRE-family HTH domain